MALPLGGAWPPAPHEIALAQQAVWSSWLTGDPQGLAEAYGAGNGASNATGQAFFKREGGVIPAVARFFWGRPSMSGQRRYRLHVPLAADIATASADLLFSEPPQFIGADQSEASKKRIDERLNEGGLHTVLLEAAEIAAGLGGCWLRLVWDADVADYVMIDPVHADSAVGEWHWGKLAAVTFFTEYQDGNDSAKAKVYRHLERHEPGAIYHGLYLGEQGKLGMAVPLEEHPSTAPFATLIDEDGRLITTLTWKGMTAAYVPNMRPQRRWRKLEALAEMGRSDFDGVEPLMDALDECYTSWMRDLRLAKARIIVPEFMLKDLGKGQGAAFDEDQEIYSQLNIAPAEQAAGRQITLKQFEIRFEAHKATADQLVDHVLQSSGYSPSTFGRGGEGDKTATEVVSRERQSERTRDKKTHYWSQGLEPLFGMWADLDQQLFKGGAKGPITVQWPDASQPDQEALARTALTLRQAEAASTIVLVRMQHPDWDETEVAAEVDLINAESGRAVPDAGPLAGE